MPLSIEVTDYQVRNRKVTIHISDVNQQELYPDRIITLEYPSWTYDIGRGSSSDEAIVPGPENAWFTSKVMSRQHAMLMAHPETKIVTIRDTGSMHGTYMNGERIIGKPTELLQHDVITFGTDIVRQAESFSPLKTKIAYEWHDENDQSSGTIKTFQNSFSADYSEEEMYSDLDDEVEIVHESVRARQPSVEIVEMALPPQSTTPSTSTSPKTNSDTNVRSSSSTTTNSSVSEKCKEKDNDGPIEQHFDDDISQLGTEMDHRFEQANLSESEQETDVPDSDIENEVSICEVEPPLKGQSSSKYFFNRAIFDKPNFLPVPQNLVMRQPSPSDAAMAKPSGVLQPGIQPTFLTAPRSLFESSSTDTTPAQNAVHNHGDNLPPFKVPVTHDYHGYPSPLWPPRNPSSFCGTTGAANSFEAYNSYALPAFQRDLFPSHSFFKPVATSSSALQSQQLSGCLAPPFSSTQLSHTALSPMASPKLTTPSDNYHSESLKRKAEEISQAEEGSEDEDDESIPSTPRKSGSLTQARSPSYAPEPSAVAIETVSPASHEPVASSGALKELATADKATEHRTAAQPACKMQESVTQAVNLLKPLGENQNMPEEPPRKMIKVSTDSNFEARRPINAKTIVKYAVTALAGATAGAIGTVIGLASLPQDYFV
ncbi:hypothetical protein LTR05_007320 [Lithohypha guttulata]|uniref:FHA domain-containing protein n=1 Tax=Lithohypha guttulata TaxID=1690604 RepID=A0AAN7SUV5_9EURO|nr:hypothetical protein LTR05_007320 [Lithohypha guttulata]